MSNIYFLISWLSNAFFVFVTLALIVEGFLGLSKIKSYRLRAFVRQIPVIALAFMPLLQYLHIGQFLNPLSCEGWFQKAIGYFSPELKSYITYPKETILTQYFFVEPFNSIIQVLLGMFITITTIIFLGRIFQICCASFQLHKLIQEATEVALPTMRNLWIVSQLKKHRIRILVSNAIQIPMAIGSRTILVSQTALDLLKPEEFESVIGHELAHLIAKDPLSRLFNQLLRAFFWWIPMKKWLKRLDEDQEIACDQMALRHQEGIASALVKMAKFSHNQEEALHAAFCALTKRSPFLLIRLEVILGISQFQESKLWRRAVPLIAGPLIFLSCTM